MRFFLFLFALCAFVGSANAQVPNCASPSTALSPVELKTQIAEIEAQLLSASRGRDFFAIADCLPATWIVKDRDTEIRVSTQRIKDEIHETGGTIEPEKRQEKLAELQAHLRLMGERAAAYSGTPYESERAKLAEILARSEFNRLSSPGLLARIQDWIQLQIKKFFMSVLNVLPETTPYFKILGWSLVLIAFALVLRALLKLLWDDRAPMRLDHTSGHVSATHWTDWLASARAAAELGDWREAIRFTYWGAVSHLEQQGCWTPDRARTPREYLRLLKESGERRTLLTQLTTRFERAWYAQQLATEAEYREVLSNVEALGCR